MIEPKYFIKKLKKNKINFITGVPDSLFKNLCIEFEKNLDFTKHIVASNEGSSIGLAMGFHLATNSVPLVYLQNSGLGNTINPLISLADEKVYKIPLILLIGWRGEIIQNVQIKDEPQHKKQGIITKDLLKVLGIRYKIIDFNSNINSELVKIKRIAIKHSSPVALLVRKNTFSSRVKDNFTKKHSYKLNREGALKILFNNVPESIVKISTTGMLSRELNELNIKKKCEKNSFLTVGGMGHAISIASGIAVAKPNTKIMCLDGDGALLMHMGSLTTSSQLKNMVHVLFNNNSHDSVGGQKTSSHIANYSKIAKNIGYKYVAAVSSEKMIIKTLKYILKKKISCFLEIKCNSGHRKNLSRPKNSPENNKKKFMNFLKKK